MNTEARNIETIAFQLILHAGNARSAAMEAIRSAKQSDFTEATQKMKEASDEFLEAHHVQSRLLEKEAAGQSIAPSILLIHAQDHLMNAMTVKEMAEEIVDLYYKMADSKKT